MKQYANRSNVLTLESPEFRAQLPAADEAGIFATLKRLRAESDERHRIRLEEIRAKREFPHYSHEEHLVDALAKCRGGQFGAWTSLCIALSHPTSEHDDSEFLVTPIHGSAGWIAASEELRAEMTEFARQFLLRVAVPIPEPKAIPWDFFGLAYALSLHASRLGENAELRAAIRPVWPLALLRHCGSEDGPLAMPLSLHFTALVPAVVAEACRYEFRERWERNEAIFGQLLPAAWCEETENALAEVLASAPLQPETYMSGLDMLAGITAASQDALLKSV